MLASGPFIWISTNAPLPIGRDGTTDQAGPENLVTEKEQELKLFRLQLKYQ